MRIRQMPRRFLWLLLAFCPYVHALNAQENATVQKVIDGDTLKIEYNQQKESIRLIGIDTPESRKNNKAYKDAYQSKRTVETIVALGKEAVKFTKSMMKPGDKVKVEFDVQQRDRYQRLLGYVYLEDGRMLNEEIIKAGYAYPLTIPPNVKYDKRFLKAFQEAMKNKRGLWK